MLGDAPDIPQAIWTRALDHALDPWAHPDPSLIPVADLTAALGEGTGRLGLDDGEGPSSEPADGVAAQHPAGLHDGEQPHHSPQPHGPADDGPDPDLEPTGDHA